MLGVLLDIILSNKLSYSKLSVTKAYFIFRPFGLFSVTGLGSRCVAVLSLESSLNQMAILVHHHALSRDRGGLSSSPLHGVSARRLVGTSVRGPSCADPPTDGDGSL